MSAIRSHAGLMLVIGFLSAESLAAPLARSEDADMTSQVTWSNNLNVKMVADLKLGSTDKICIKSAGDDPIKVAAHSQASDEIRYNNEDTVYPAPYKACRNLRKRVTWDVFATSPYACRVQISRTTDNGGQTWLDEVMVSGLQCAHIRATCSSALDSPSNCTNRPVAINSRHDTIEIDLMPDSESMLLQSPD